jgi:hypothetical protein
MEYDFNQLDPIKFQRLVNSILVAQFGADVRLTPLRGPDGGRDGETAPGHPYFEFQATDSPPLPQGMIAPRSGRYLFQVKHHLTIDKRLSDARSAVVSDFAREFKDNVLSRKGDEQVNYFFLITNVPSSETAIMKVDKKRRELLTGVPDLHADVWWKEQIVAYLDQMPSIWNSFPEIFPGGRVPVLAKVVGEIPEELPRAVRLAVGHQYRLDKSVKFRQIELEQGLSRLFVNLDVDVRDFEPEERHALMPAGARWAQQTGTPEEWDELAVPMPSRIAMPMPSQIAVARHLRQIRRGELSVLGLILNVAEQVAMRKILLEGGPGQGKSTITQMAAQIYRQQILGTDDMDPEGRWVAPLRVRLPFRLELRKFAEWLDKNPDSSVEQYLALTISRDSGGNEVTVDDIHSIVERSPVLLVFDGLDEVGSDELRDDVITAILDCTHRLEHDLHSDLRVIVTTRPPAMAGRRERLIDFRRIAIAPMGDRRIGNYVKRWLSVQIDDDDERQRIRESFERRQREYHVRALAQNPMQLSVLLQFIGLKGEAFPDRRAELYRDYFQIVIDRDVEKSPELRENRDIIVALHEFLGYKIHALTEVSQANRTLARQRLLEMVEAWLRSRGNDPAMAGKFFRLGEERFGLIVAPKGEGVETRYGFEVQPIQEYFAAAFISNQIPPDKAHEVFEAMVRRPFWREVALFLAGLRRPNEKADLISRARRLDQDEALGWRQDGRAIALQLLREGVFSDPRYIFSQALDFVLDLLDTKNIPVQREPENLLEALTTLVKRDATQEHKRRLLSLLHEYDSCSDEFVIFRIFSVAAQLLDPSQMEQAIMSCKACSPDVVSRLRLEWPCRWGMDIRELAEDASFWQGVPDSVWAQAWWQAALVHDEAICDLPAPLRFHQRLAEQFAANPISISMPRFYGQPVRKLSSNWAIWKLVHYHQILNFVASGQSAVPPKQVDRWAQLIGAGTSDTDFAGLEEPIRSLVESLLELSHELLIATVKDEPEVGTALKHYAQSIQEHLSLPGLASWLACRSGMNILQAFLTGSVLRRREPETNLFSLIANEKQFLSLMEALRFFYVDPTSKTNGAIEGPFTFFDFYMRPLSPYYLPFSRHSDVPKYVRLEAKGKLVAVVDLLAARVSGQRDLPFKWMEDIPFTAEIIRPLVERCRDHLPNLLVALSKLHFVNINAGRRLRVQDTQRILKIARNTDDANILTGALIALSHAKFLRIAKPELILRLIGVDSTKADFATSLFRYGHMIQESPHDERGPDAILEETEVVRTVAKEVLASPEDYAFRVICAAAEFLGEYDKISLPPLLSEEVQFGIEIS